MQTISNSRIEKLLVMKKDTHPKNYKFVVFKDMSNDYSFITRSTANTKETIVWEDGKEYPLVKLEISYKSHPFFTGKMKLVDTAGRVDKFKSRYDKFAKKPVVSNEVQAVSDEVQADNNEEKNEE